MALKERGIERSVLQHDVCCYEMVHAYYQAYFLDMNGPQALDDLNAIEALKVALYLGFAPPRTGGHIRVPPDMPDDDVCAAVVSCWLLIEPVLTPAELELMLSRTTEAVNRRYGGEDIVRTQLWQDLMSYNAPKLTREQLHDWLQELGVLEGLEGRPLDLEALPR